MKWNKRVLSLLCAWMMLFSSLQVNASEKTSGTSQGNLINVAETVLEDEKTDVEVQMENLELKNDANDEIVLNTNQDNPTDEDVNCDIPKASEVNSTNTDSTLENVPSKESETMENSSNDGDTSDNTNNATAHVSKEENTASDKLEKQASEQNLYELKVVIHGPGNIEILMDESILQKDSETYLIESGDEIITILNPAETHYIHSVKLNGNYVEVNDINSICIMPEQNSELEITFDEINPNRIGKAPRINQVTYNQTITNSFGHKTSKFQVNGIWAWCCDAHNTTPAKGDLISSIEESSNVNLRKVLWYGCLGPGALLENNNDGWMQTGQAASMALGNGRVHSRYEAWYENVITKPAPPEGFKAYVATPSNGKQKLCYFIYTPEVDGKLTAVKSSSNSSVTNGNSCYSLEGAEYGVYSDSSCKNKVGTLVFNAEGKANTLTLKAGTYYLKEISAPKGYALSATVTTVKVTANLTTTATVTNYPQMDPIGILVGKKDAETNQNKPQGSASLAGAQFTVKYYKGHYDTDPSTLGVSATRQWVFETDQDGFAHLSDSYKVSGDALWKTSSGVASLPLGTVTIQETKAPEGYLLNPEIFVRKITASGTAENVYTYNAPEVPENILKLVLVKKQTGTDITIPNVQFEHTRPNGIKEIFTTNASGKITINGLEYGQHTLREISAPEGYVINQNEVKFTLGTDNRITLDSSINHSSGEISFSVTDAGNIAMTVFNNLAPYSISVHKFNNKDLKLEGAEFTLYSDSACTNIVQVLSTDENGNLTFENLSVGTKYYLRETKAPQGYRIPVDESGNPIVREIYATSIPAQNEFAFYIDGVKFDTNSTGDYTVTGTAGERVVNVKVMNEITYKLPETGSHMTIVLVGAGILCMVFAFTKKDRPKDKHKRERNKDNMN